MASSRASGLDGSSLLSERVIADQKRAAGKAAAELVEDGMRLGLGTGSTVAYLLEALGERELPDIECAATSPATARAARALGLVVRDLDELGELDLAIDGADQVDPEGWLVKGGGGAHTREKIVAAAARRFVVIASANKAVEELAAPVPLELMSFAVKTTLRLLVDAKLRPAPDAPDPAGLGAGAPSCPDTKVQWWQSPDGGLIADYLGPIGHPRACSARLAAVPGVIEHGLFPPEMVSLVLIARHNGIERRAGKKPDT